MARNGSRHGTLKRSQKNKRSLKNTLSFFQRHPPDTASDLPRVHSVAMASVDRPSLPNGFARLAQRFADGRPWSTLAARTQVHAVHTKPHGFTVRNRPVGSVPLLQLLQRSR